ncbi:MAG: hypothetical protein WA964_13255 [Ilumatobacter sp.]|uniref:hypothetical protein n=1 Tax=Ilumatobacter sp. TaxID=1967498 RepID=UPI003C769EE1
MRRVVPLLLVLAACVGSAGDGDSTLPLSIPNQGGSLEGHGPRGFAGQGVGLFAGDELNPSFPADDGIQIWLTFDVSSVVAIQRAVLRSDALSVRGDPFETLGELRVEQVDDSAFEPESFDLPATSDPAACSADVGAGTFECDVTEIVAAAAVAGDERVQLRLKFDELSDGDGETDLAMFFLTDSNTNEAGIFTLEIS